MHPDFVPVIVYSRFSPLKKWVLNILCPVLVNKMNTNWMAGGSWLVETFKSPFDQSQSPAAASCPPLFSSSPYTPSPLPPPHLFLFLINLLFLFHLLFLLPFSSFSPSLKNLFHHKNEREADRLVAVPRGSSVERFPVLVFLLLLISQSFKPQIGLSDLRGCFRGWNAASLQVQPAAATGSPGFLSVPPGSPRKKVF